MLTASQYVRSQIGVLALTNNKEQHMGTKAHLVNPQALVRSVMTATEAPAACGFSKVYTRESIEAAQAIDKTCKGCLAAVGDDIARGDEATLHPAKGWAALLELAWQLKEDEKSRPTTVTFKFGNPKQWGLPLAA